MHKSNDPAFCYSVREILADELSADVFERISSLIDRLDSRAALYDVSPGPMKSCSIYIPAHGGPLALFSIYRSGGTRHLSVNLHTLDSRGQVTRQQVERFVEPLRQLPELIPEDAGDEIYGLDPHAPVEIVFSEWSAVDRIIDAADQIRSA